MILLYWALGVFLVLLQQVGLCAAELTVHHVDDNIAAIGQRKTRFGPISLKNKHYGLQEVGNLTAELTFFTETDWARFCEKSDKELVALDDEIAKRFEGKLVVVSRYTLRPNFEECFYSSPLYKNFQFNVDFAENLRPLGLIFGVTAPFQPGLSYTLVYDDVGRQNVMPTVTFLELGTDATMDLFRLYKREARNQTLSVSVTLDDVVCDYQKDYRWAIGVMKLLGLFSLGVGILSFLLYKTHRRPNPYSTVVLLANSISLSILGIIVTIGSFRLSDTLTFGANAAINLLNLGTAAALDGLIAHRWESTNVLLKTRISSGGEFFAPTSGLDLRLKFLSCVIILDWLTMFANYYVSRQTSFVLYTVLPGLFSVLQLYCTVQLIRQMLDIIRTLKTMKATTSQYLEKSTEQMVHRMRFWIGTSVLLSITSMIGSALVAGTKMVYTCDGYIFLSSLNLLARVLNGLSQTIIMRGPPKPGTRKTRVAADPCTRTESVSHGRV